jgi:YHS domain-containing protein
MRVRLSVCFDEMSKTNLTMKGDQAMLRHKVLSVGLSLAACVIAAPAFAGEAGDPYPLDSCVLSGKKLASVETPVVVNHEGREIKFCCNNCKGKFEADPAAVLSKVDTAIVEQQKAHYPLDTCVVSGDKLGGHGDVVEYVYNNRLIRLCCADCEDAIKKDPAAVFGKLDAAVIEKEKDAYPLTKCPVSGQDLGSMGEPKNIVVANQLIKLCCGGCEKQIKKDPAKFLAMVNGGGAGEATEKKEN